MTTQTTTATRAAPKLVTMLKVLRERGMLKESYWHLHEALGPGWPDTKPIPLARIAEVAEYRDVLWVLCRGVAPRSRPAAKQRLGHLMADYIQRVLPIFEATLPGDPRVRECIATIRHYADGEMTRTQVLDAAAQAEDAYYSVAYSEASFAASFVVRAAYLAAHAVADADHVSAAVAASYCSEAAHAATGGDYAAHVAEEQAWQVERYKLVVGPSWSRTLHTRYYRLTLPPG